MPNLLDFLFGYEHMSFDASLAADVMNICINASIICHDQRNDGKYIEFNCSRRAASKLKALCEQKGIYPIASKEKGLPSLLGRYRKRYGIFAGALVFALLIFLSGLFIWDVRIEGERTLSEAEIRETLEICGLRIGSSIRKLKTDVIQNRVLIASDKISWIAINLSGTVAHVEVRERQTGNGSVDPESANLVAICDGQIEVFEEVRGNIIVKKGDFVKEGDLLVGGIYDSEAQGFIYTCAKGKVMARTEEKHHIEIPLKYEKKVATGESFCEKYLIFFNKSIKIYSNSRKMTSTCDTIDTVEYLKTASGEKTPFGIRTVRYIEYEYVEAERDADEAVELALVELRNLLDTPDTHLLSKEFSSSFTDDRYILDCTVRCIKNIAKQVEIKIER